MTTLDTTWAGLSAEQAAKRLLVDGPNELPSQKNRTIFSILYNVIREPMLLLLLSCGGIYLLLGEPSDAWMLLTFVLVVVGITFYQERKTERALEALKNIATPIACVFRDGIERKIASRDLVVDDIVVIREGDRIPGDAKVLESSNLLIDESILTGESASVRKTVWNGITQYIQPGGEDLPYVYSGTLVTQGHAIVKIISIGIHTEVGKIGKSLTTIKEEDMLLKKETGKIVKQFAIAGIILCILTIGIYGYIYSDWMKGILAGLTLSMAMLPEEFSVVLVIFLTLGAWRMSKRNVLVRNTSAIETLGAATVLCVDKTGTITENKMVLEGVWTDNKLFPMQAIHKENVSAHVTRLLEYAVLASQKNPYDAMEKEIVTRGHVVLSKELARYAQWSVIREYPLSKEQLSVSHVWKSPDSKELIVAAKGAPETIADLCHFNEKQITELEGTIHELALQGYRILGVAGAKGLKTDTATKQHDYPFEFIGLLVFTDPVRPGLQQAVRDCYGAGIRVIMITGDYKGTAQTIAKQIGLLNPEECITGTELTSMTQKELSHRIRSVNIFARVIPEQKLLIVKALKDNEEIVAMTGDGVNDAPALKAAHIGIAMGERGTDVARETADIILLDDNFLSIVTATRMGRRIFDNLKKAMMYIVSVHIPIAGMSLLPLLFGLPVVLYPAHIAFLELIIDPACSTVFEAEEEEADIMKRSPRKLFDPLFGKTTLIFSLLQGFGVLIAVFTVYMIGIRSGLEPADSRTLAFVTIVLANILLIITNLSRQESIFQILKNNKTLQWIIVSTLTALGFVLYIPFLRNVFHFTQLHPIDIVYSLGLAFVCLMWFQIIKKIPIRI